MSVLVAGLAELVLGGPAGAEPPSVPLPVSPFAAALPAGAAQPPASHPTISQPIQLLAGTGVLVRLPRAVATVMSAQPDIARVQPASPTSLFLTGVAPGRTTVIATTASGDAIVVYDITVGSGSQTPPPASPVIPATVAPAGVSAATARAVQVAIARMVKGAAEVKVRTAGRDVILAGTLPNAAASQQAMAIARAYVGEAGGVLNETVLLDSIQVNVRVRIAEIDRQITRQLGFNWQALGDNSNFDFGFPTGTVASGEINPPYPLGVARLSGTSGVPAPIGGLATRNRDVTAVVDALAADRLIHILAEPNLTAQSGDTASFLAGGEFPIPVASGRSNGEASIAIGFKQYGVSLAVVPTVLSLQRLTLRVRPEVSKLSTTNALSVPVAGGTLTIPALTVRRADATVALGSGQSFAIAGLLENTGGNTSTKALPLSGPLFKSNDFQRGETELVIIVTPYLVKPAPASSALHLPTEGFRPATDLDRILLGRQVAAGGSGPSLDAGFILK